MALHPKLEEVGAAHCNTRWGGFGANVQKGGSTRIQQSAGRDGGNNREGEPHPFKAGVGGHSHPLRWGRTNQVIYQNPRGTCVQAIQDIGDLTTITQTFEMYRVGNWNLSHASLTSPEALAAVDVYDDGYIPLGIVLDHLQGEIPLNFTVDVDGGIVRSGNTEASDAEEEEYIYV
ncbi:hypothetical protein C8R44DRAFT_750383 [Mycena epipterygia]|nr:hypothetical protein C8R44DRAFT_750383 [Mycena epipterygia]